jgi:NAD(P)-dependent dehydrogenase (short-subunit alcohol dehydrogenase family)
VVKQVLVTGAAQGLGVAIVETLVGRGWTVWATDVQQEALASSPAQHTAVMDVTDPASVAAVVADIDAAGGIGAVVNNAGIFPLRAWEEHDAELMHRVFGVNVVGPMQVSQAAAKSMIARGVPGAIVNVVSLAFYKGHATGLAYSASKGGLIGLTRSLAKAFGPHNIRINAVAPGFMSTEGTQALIAKGDMAPDRLAGVDPDRQLPGITEVSGAAAAIAMMLGDDAREITGQILAADGGTYFI